jgi:hypothetical protein
MCRCGDINTAECKSLILRKWVRKGTVQEKACGGDKAMAWRWSLSSAYLLSLVGALVAASEMETKDIKKEKNVY